MPAPRPERAVRLARCDRARPTQDVYAQAPGVTVAAPARRTPCGRDRARPPARRQASSVTRVRRLARERRCTVRGPRDRIRLTDAGATGRTAARRSDATRRWDGW